MIYDGKTADISLQWYYYESHEMDIAGYFKKTKNNGNIYQLTKPMFMLVKKQPVK